MATSDVCRILGPFATSGLVQKGRVHICGVTVDGADGTNSVRIILRDGIVAGSPWKWSYTIPGSALAGGRNFVRGPVFANGLYLEISTDGTAIVWIEVAE